MEHNWSHFNQKGWCFLDSNAEHHQWIDSAKASIVKKFDQRKYKKSDFRSGATWFTGINFLDNGPNGDINGKPFSSEIWFEISEKFGSEVKYWDAAQVSICWKGYPIKDSLESENSFRYRLKRYSSHLDGLIPVGQKKRRFAKEFHAFILGIPLLNNSVDAAPLVVWEGSHIIFRDIFRRVYSGLSESEISALDVTEIYHKYRKEVFSSCCTRKVVPYKNQPYILDRHLLHGVVPWKEDINSSSIPYEDNALRLNPMTGRIVTYFRPPHEDPTDWVVQD